MATDRSECRSAPHLHPARTRAARSARLPGMNRRHRSVRRHLGQLELTKRSRRHRPARRSRLDARTARPRARCPGCRQVPPGPRHDRHGAAVLEGRGAGGRERPGLFARRAWLGHRFDPVLPDAPRRPRHRSRSACDRPRGTTGAACLRLPGPAARPRCSGDRDPASSVASRHRSLRDRDTRPGARRFGLRKPQGSRTATRADPRWRS